MVLYEMQVVRRQALGRLMRHPYLESWDEGRAVVAFQAQRSSSSSELLSRLWRKMASQDLTPGAAKTVDFISLPSHQGRP